METELRKLALALATRHLSKEPHNVDTILNLADVFYKWLTQDVEASAETMHTVDPQAPYGKDVVSKAKLKESVQHLREYYRNRQMVMTAAQLAGYDEAIKDVLRVIDVL